MAKKTLQGRLQGRLVGGATTVNPPKAFAPAAKPVPKPVVAPAMQPDPTLIAQQGLNLQSYQNTLGGLAQQELGTKQAYGWDDTSNPFSQARQLQQAYENRGRSNTNSFAGSGQLYSGALQNAQNESSRRNLQDVDTSRRSYESALAGIAAKRAGAKEALDSGNIQAFGASIDRQLAVRPLGDPDAVAATPKAATGGVQSGRVTARSAPKAESVFLQALKRKRKGR